MTFVDYVRGYIREYGYDHLEHCIEVAIDRCLEENILREFLIQRRTEVVKVMELDYTFDKRILLERKESREEGWEEGFTRGRILTYYEMNLTPKEIADKLCLPEEKVEEVIRNENTDKNN